MMWNLGLQHSFHHQLSHPALPELHPTQSNSQVPSHPINTSTDTQGEHTVKHKVLTQRLTRLAHSVPIQQTVICLGVQKVLASAGLS